MKNSIEEQSSSDEVHQVSKHERFSKLKKKQKQKQEKEEEEYVVDSPSSPSSSEGEPHSSNKTSKSNKSSSTPISKEASTKELWNLISTLSEIRDNLPQIEQPKEIKNVKMRDYQLIGLSWLISRYEQNICALLGDEMGLGKTLQSISFLAYLYFKKQIRGPFLVICPLTTVENWNSEITTFCPKLKCLKYIGSQTEREEIQKEMKRQSKKGESFDVLLTTYELVLNDSEFLRKFKWKCFIIDEAQRLKNYNSKLYVTLQSEFNLSYVLLLTGTPVQNNLTELWSLLHFLDSRKFNNLDLFKIWFESVEDSISKYSSKPSSASSVSNSNSSVNRVAQLHAILRPYLLRRVKADVLSEIPEKIEIVVHCGMSAMQKKYYKSILAKDVNAISNSKSRISLMNIIMQLRKVCNHPYLFEGAEPLFNGEYKLGDHIINNSGKMVLLDKILTRLKEQNHRILLFSQMTRTLDILQDYLHFRGYSYERLDGSIRGEERFLAIKNFSQEDVFIFLLSTRAGGLGLNLTAADTVIFFDNDWNPQKDLQAEARAHRIGQTKTVRVLRLITQHTVEEIILKRAIQKLQLTHQIIEEGNFSQSQDPFEPSSHFELQDIIKYGLKNILSSGESTITDEDIDAILNPQPKKETKNLKKLERSEENVQSMYEYEGVDYSKPQPISTTFNLEDEQAFNKLVEERTQKMLSSNVPTEKGEYESRTLRKRAITTESIEITREKKRLKKEEKKKQKWIELGYESKALSIPTIEPSNLETLETEEEDQEIHFVSGDCVSPQGPADSNAIIVNCIDNSGEWGSGGFFTAISNLSSEPEDEYTKAGEMKDLDLGSVHLVEVGPRGKEDKFKLYVANCIVQKRTKTTQKISGILIPELQQALKTLANEAKRISATVHLPRIGYRISNWYSIERTIRTTLIQAKIPTYIYYYKRKIFQNPPSSQSMENSASKKEISSTKPKNNNEQEQNEKMEEEEEEFILENPNKHQENRNLPSELNTTPELEVKNLLEQDLPSLFNGRVVFLFQIQDKEEEKLLERYVVAFGGIVEKKVSSNVTQIISGKNPSSSAVLSCLLNRFPTLECVSPLWIKDSVNHQKSFPTSFYKLK